jgi:hypothetical protein
MRILFGIVLGAFLTVGGAYAIDLSMPAAAGDMVNWQLAGEHLHAFGQMAGDRIGQLFGS